MEREIRLKNYLAYGVGDFVGGGAQVVISALFLFFLVNVIGLSPSMAGLAILLGKGWDAVSDPLMGYISDHTRSRFGRRRVYFIVGFIPLALSFTMMWIPVQFSSQTFILAWYIAAYLLFSTFLTMVWAPFTALNAEMSRDDRKRHNLTFTRMVCSGISGFLSATFPMVIVRQFPGNQGWLVMGLIFGLFYSLPLIFTFFGTWELPRPSRSGIEGGKKNIMDVYRDFISLFGNRSFRHLLGMYVFAFLTMDLVLALFVFFVTDVLLLGEIYPRLMMGIYIGGAVIPLYVWLGNRWGKGRAYLLGAVFWALGLVATMFYTRETPLAILFAGPVLMGVGQCACTFMPWAILPSVTDVDELMTTQRRAGVYAGMMTLLRKLVQALALFLIGHALELLGYAEGASMPAQVVQGIRWLWFTAPLLMITGGFLCGLQLKITPRNHRLLMAEIDRLIDGGSKEEVTPETRKVCELLTGKKYEMLFQPPPRRSAG